MTYALDADQFGAFMASASLVVLCLAALVVQGWRR